MKLKIDHVFQAAETVTAIINANRPTPQKGAYRLARLYAKLKPEYDLIAQRRNAMIEDYGYKAPLPVNVEGGSVTLADSFSVPPDKMEEWAKVWAEVANEEIDVEVEPIPLEHLTLADGAATITAAELIVLNDLVEG